MKMMRQNRIVLILLAVAALSALFYWFSQPAKEDRQVRMVISPYQDLAMMVNVKPLRLDEKYGFDLQLKTIPWEQTLPTIASVAGDVDVGFASLSEFLAKQENLNASSADPVEFFFPAYVFRGGAFVTFTPNPQPLFNAGALDNDRVQAFLRQKIALSRNTLYQVLVYQLAKNLNIPTKQLSIVDVGFDEGMLAAQKGDVAYAAVGLTQLTEATKRGASTVLKMDDIGFADITGFVAKRSTIQKKRALIEGVVRAWFDATAHVMSNVDQNASVSLDYLAKNAATKYTLDEYKRALSQEHFPTSLSQARADMLEPSGRYSMDRIYDFNANFLVDERIIKARPPKPLVLTLN